MAPLLLRPMRAEDEVEVRSAHAELEQDDFTFLLSWSPSEPWNDYISRLELERLGIELGEGRVPSTFLLAEIDGSLIGRVSIRHELNQLLENFGGHIGYCVRPAFRRRGYATELLRQALVLAREFGIADVLVVCDEDNAASAAVIERLGGVLEDMRADEDGILMRRYWIH